MTGRYFRCATRRLWGGLLIAVVVAFAGLRPSAQEMRQRGQNIAPAYEGWERNPDGSFNLVFGYFNRNWEQEIDVPAGAGNTIEPGGPDMGQPTHFLPRRNRFVFRIRVPADFGKKELLWTLTSNGKTELAYATLKPEYFIDKLVIIANTGAGGGGGGGDNTLHDNEPPTLRVDGETARVAKVGRVVTLTAFATDDGLPQARFHRGSAKPSLYQTARIAPNSWNGLRVSWFVYRGAANIAFEPRQIDTWEDSREGGNSALSPGFAAPPVPPDGKYVSQVTFTAPGTYVLRCLAHDGGAMVSKDVTFVVTP